MEFLFISDFTINQLGITLKKELPNTNIKTTIAPFNQVQQTLLNLDSDVWSGNIDACVIWTLPENLLKNFNHFLNGDQFDYQLLLNEVYSFINLIIRAKEKVKKIYLFDWCLDQTLYYDSIKINGEKLNAIELINKLNLILKDELSKHPTVQLIDSNKQISQVGAVAYNSKLWYLSKTPFNLAVFNFAAKEIAYHINSELGLTKKVIVLDLDETLWGGILGDDGVDNLLLGGHHPIGEAYKDFQKTLKTLKNKGILLAISSKNDEKNALNAIENHPEMVLRKSDFVTWRINWIDKAKNIQEIATELNLGLDSFVFIDDNPFERERVKNSIPNVYTPDLPTDPMLYKQFLLQLNCFNFSAITEEDKKRTQLYSDEQNRTESKNSFLTVEEWLKSIDIQVQCSKVNSNNFQRTLQLINKTNQMNLQSHRYSENEFQMRLDDHQISYYTISVKDNFGDAGLTGVIGLFSENDTLLVTDFLLSCRVMGRKIEDVMLTIINEIAVKENKNNIIIKFINTEKNIPCQTFFEKTELKISENTYGWTTFSKSPKTIEYITIQWIN